MFDKKLIWLSIITFVGGFFRFYNLGLPPLWVDEGLFVYMFDEGVFREHIPVLINGLFSPKTEFWIRFPFAVCGTLTIPAVYWVLKNKKLALYACVLVALFPLFVWWSRMARPYAFVGLFVVLGWRWTPAYFLGVLSSPVALFGLNLAKIKKRWLWYVIIVSLAVIVFFIRPDAERITGFTDLNWLKRQHRHWYVPILVGMLYLFEYGIPYLGYSYSKFRAWAGRLVCRYANHSRLAQ